ncbi:MAG: hypothetical protein R3E42_09640 [Burkholderiaceae bacterium]
MLAIPVMRAWGKAPPVLNLRAPDIEEAIRQTGLEALSAWTSEKTPPVYRCQQTQRGVP